MICHKYRNGDSLSRCELPCAVIDHPMLGILCYTPDKSDHECHCESFYALENCPMQRIVWNKSHIAAASLPYASLIIKRKPKWLMSCFWYNPIRHFCTWYEFPNYAFVQSVACMYCMDKCMAAHQYEFWISKVKRNIKNICSEQFSNEIFFSTVEWELLIPYMNR